MQIDENIPNRSSEQFSNKIGATSRSIESAHLFLTGGLGTNPSHESFEQTRLEQVRQEQGKIIEWATKNNLLIPSPDFYAKGGEHYVDLPEISPGKVQFVTKFTNPNSQKGYGIALGSYSLGALPSEYLDRLILQNEIFGDQIKLKGIAKIMGKPSIVTTQPFYQGINPPEKKIDDLMLQELGFEKLAQYTYYLASRNILTYDLKPANIIVNANGMHVFDPVVQRINQDFADFLREELGKSIWF